jgi:hypothetical protein
MIAMMAALRLMLAPAAIFWVTQSLLLAVVDVHIICSHAVGSYIFTSKLCMRLMSITQ